MRHILRSGVLAAAALLLACNEDPIAPTRHAPLNGSMDVIGVVGVTAGPVTDLGTLGGTESFALDINDKGQIVGNSATADGQNHAFLWQDGSMRDLGTLGGTVSFGFGINASGQIVGGSSISTTSNAQHSFLWHDGVMQDLGSLGFFSNAARGINDKGQIVVNTRAEASGEQHALLWQDGAVQDLGTLGRLESAGLDINDNGQIVGNSHTTLHEESHAFLWQDGTMHDLGTLGGTFSNAFGVNDKGEIVGVSYTAADYPHAFLWQDGVMQDLGTLGLASEGLDINDNSQIVGSSYTPAGAHAFFWTESAGMVDLFTATGLTTATGINNNLQVVGRLGNGHAALVQLMLVTNNPPVAATGGPYTSAEGAAVNLSLTGTDPDDDALTFTWDLGDGTAGTGATPPASHVYGDGPAQHTITLTVRDADGGTDTKTTIVTVSNVAPSADFNSASSIDEGTDFALSLTNGRDVPADVAAGLEYRFDCGTGVGSWSPVPAASCPTDDNGTRAVRAEVRDKDGGVSAYLGSVAVNNVAPVLGALTVPLDPVPLGAVVNASASFTDPGAADTHVGFVQWDLSFAFDLASPGVDQAAHTLAAASVLAAGVHTVSLRVQDDDGGEDTRAASSYVVVYDPSAGFVTGGGWIVSPAGSYAPDPALAGKASFGFVAKYVKGANAPSGSTEFQFQTARFAFQSTSYQWLVVAGARAQFKGEGSINGGPTVYAFLLTAVDGEANGGGGSDRFRIKMWDRNSGAVIYDNQRGAAEDADAATALGGGSIVIHQR